MGLLQANKAQNLPNGVAANGPFIVLPLRCMSHTYGLFELTDTVEIRIRVKDTTQVATSAAAGSAAGSKTVSTFANTLHGAFTNSASSSSIVVATFFSKSHDMAKKINGIFFSHGRITASSFLI